MPEPTTSLIEGVVRYPLEVHGDERGEFVEIFRNQWLDNFAPVQWNFLRSAGNVLRGFHCHIHHTDLLAMVEGTMILGLKDLRVESPTHGVSEVIVLRPTTELLMIPPGIGHGFYFPEPAMLVYSVSHVWSTEDELGCRWDRFGARSRLGGRFADAVRARSDGGHAGRAATRRARAAAACKPANPDAHSLGWASRKSASCCSVSSSVVSRWRMYDVFNSRSSVR